MTRRGLYPCRVSFWEGKKQEERSRSSAQHFQSRRIFLASNAKVAFVFIDKLLYSDWQHLNCYSFVFGSVRYFFMIVNCLILSFDITYTVYVC